MVAQERINVCETVVRKNNCKLNFFSMYVVRNNKEVYLSFNKNSRHKLWLKFEIHREVNGQFFFRVPRQGVSYYWKSFRKDKWGPTLRTLPYCFSPYFWDKGVTFLFSYNLRNIIGKIGIKFISKVLKQWYSIL